MKIYKPEINLIKPSFERNDLIPLLKYETGMITDVMGRKNAISGLKSLTKKSKFVGEAITVDAMPGCNLMVHLALDLSFEGCVLVVDGKGDISTSILGGIQAYYAKKRGVSAIVIDGVIRDLDEIRKIEIPIYAKGTSPVGPHKGWGDSINTPISCSGTVINPGDVLVGDNDGIVVIPKKRVFEVLEYCQEKKLEEKNWIKEIDSGAKLIKTLGLNDNLMRFHVDYDNLLRKREDFDK